VESDAAAVSALALDTHAWVWWLSAPERLSRGQRTAIDRVRKGGREPLLLSVISCWEVALLAQHGRFRFSIPTDVWLEQATTVPGLRIVALSLPIIVTAARLVALKDPADMLIVATAQHNGAQLVTSDSRIDESGLITVVA